MPGDFRAALRIVWIAIGSVLFGVLLAPWIFTPAQIAAVTPRCEWKARYGKECFLCGMTTAFIDIAHGRLREAERSNRGSIPLYAAFVLNDGLLALVLTGRLGFSKTCSAS
jgi:hypothetical protein